MRCPVFVFPALASITSLVASVASASDPAGIYARIDKAIVEPDREAPATIRLWGAFSLAARGPGDRYDPPVRGYLYYSVDPGKERECRAAWNDLRRAAGTGQCVAFASRYGEKGRVRRAGEAPRNPDPFPAALGVVKLRARSDIAERLLAVPRPVAPADEDLIPPGKVRLAVRDEAPPRRDPKPDGDGGSGGFSGASGDLKVEGGDGGDGGGVREKAAPAPAAGKTVYVFEIESPSGKKERSPEIAPQGGKAEWTPSMAIDSPGRYVWRARRIEDGRPGLEAAMEFSAKVAR